jgi:hypothetical protein
MREGNAGEKASRKKLLGVLDNHNLPIRFRCYFVIITFDQKTFFAYRNFGHVMFVECSPWFLFNFPAWKGAIVFSLAVFFFFTYLSRSSSGSTDAAKSKTEDKYTVEVVIIAAIVPTGIDFWGSAKSPERLEPAMMPTRRKKICFRGQIAVFFGGVSISYFLRLDRSSDSKVQKRPLEWPSSGLSFHDRTELSEDKQMAMWI